MQQAQLIQGQRLMIGGQEYVLQLSGQQQPPQFQQQQQQPQLQQQPQQQPQLQQQPQIIIVNDPNRSPKLQVQGYNTKMARVCGYSQIACGIITIIFSTVAAIIDYNRFWEISAGWWGSAFIIAAGSLGAVSAAFKTRALIIATLLFSVIAAVMAIPLYIQCGFSLGNGWQWRGSSNGAAYNAMNVMIIVMATAELGFSIYQCVLCSNVLCCNNMTMIQAQNNAGMNPQQGQQFVYFNNAMMPEQQPQMQMQQQQFMQQQFMQQQFIQPQQQFGQQQCDDQGGATPQLPPSYDTINDGEVEKTVPPTY